MSSRDRNRPIVVGVDDVPDNADALMWAVAEAKATGRPLRLVHAFEWLADQAPYYRPVKDAHMDAGIRAEFEHRARETVGRASEFVRALNVRVPMSSHVTEGTPALVLAEEGRGAAMLVLGSHERGLAGRVLMGSVGSAVAEDPPCPVTVVRGRGAASPEGSAPPVVAGVDGSASSEAALRFAAGHAVAHQARLVLLHSWHTVSRRSGGAVIDQYEHHDDWVHGLVDAVHKDHPSLDIVRAVTETRPAHALVDWSERARLVVVGTSERHRHLGSVSQALLHHAWSPVTVVPADSLS